MQRNKGSKSVKEQGEVKWFNDSLGYGFIERQSGEDIFVHWNQIQNEGFKTLAAGQFVEFVVADSPKGLNANEVIVLD
jgi:CspA family cold shock protein